jgi:hypothetical protein
MGMKLGIVPTTGMPVAFSPLNFLVLSVFSNALFKEADQMHHGMSLF